MSDRITFVHSLQKTADFSWIQPTSMIILILKSRCSSRNWFKCALIAAFIVSTRGIETNYFLEPHKIYTHSIYMST